MIEKINVFPNPYFEWEDDNRFYGKDAGITFSNLPDEVTIRIYTLSGKLIRTLTENDKQSIYSPFIFYDLKNDHNERIALEFTSHG